MTNAYSSPERTEAYMQHLDNNEEQIKKLRQKMTGPGMSMADRVTAFTALYHLHSADPHAQRRLVVNLEHTALRQLQLEATH